MSGELTFTTRAQTLDTIARTIAAHFVREGVKWAALPRGLEEPSLERIQSMLLELRTEAIAEGSTIESGGLRVDPDGGVYLLLGQWVSD